MAYQTVQKPICPNCDFTKDNCPLKGMTDFFDKPLYGQMIECESYRPTKPLLILQYPASKHVRATTIP